jgi:LysR family cys regulon transcriptional activator
MAAVAVAQRWPKVTSAMNLHQFRFVQEAVRRNLNLTETAKALFTSQPGISKAILELEEELGVDIFARHGKRLRRVTEPGQLVLKSIETIMREVANLKRIGDEYSKQDAGTLSIATTHTQARYFLPQPRGRAAPALSPRCRWCCTRACPSRWRACCWTTWPTSAWPPNRWPPRRADHPALLRMAARDGGAGQAPAGAVERPTLEQLAAVPLVMYHPTMTGRTRIDQAFARARLKPQVALEASTPTSS